MKYILIMLILVGAYFIVFRQDVLIENNLERNTKKISIVKGEIIKKFGKTNFDKIESFSGNSFEIYHNRELLENSKSVYIKLIKSKYKTLEDICKNQVISDFLQDGVFDKTIYDKKTCFLYFDETESTKNQVVFEIKGNDFYNNWFIKKNINDFILSEYKEYLGLKSEIKKDNHKLIYYKKTEIPGLN